jgi:hypothetical protein
VVLTPGLSEQNPRFIPKLKSPPRMRIVKLRTDDGMQRARLGPPCGSYALAQSLQGPAPQSRTFPTQHTRCKQGRAFANRFSRDRRLLKKDKQRLGGHPDDPQESDRHDSQHYERPEMMIIRLAAHRAFFFHATRWYQPESAGGLHRKKKKPIAGRSQAYTEQARDGGRV